MNRISLVWLAVVLLGAAFVLPHGVAAQYTEAQPTDAQSAEVQPTDAQRAEAQPTDAQSAEAQPTDAQSEEAQPTDAQSVEAQSAEAQPTDAQSAEAQSAEAQSADAQSTETQRVQAPPSGEKSRMTILNLVPEVSPMNLETGLPEGLPVEFRKASEFEITDLKFTGRMIVEWSRGGPVAQQSRAEKLGRFYEVPLMVSGRVHAINGRRWVVSFVKLNVPRGRGRQKSVNSKPEFYTILDERDPALKLVLLEHSSAFGFRKSLEGTIRKKRVCEDALSEEEAKSLFVDKTLVLVEEFYVKFRSDGVWEVSSNPETMKERGEWWMEGKRLCETVPRVAKPPCRCIKKDDKGEYNFVWEGGSQQHFRFQ